MIQLEKNNNESLSETQLQILSLQREINLLNEKCDNLQTTINNLSSIFTIQMGEKTTTV